MNEIDKAAEMEARAQRRMKEYQLALDMDMAAMQQQAQMQPDQRVMLPIDMLLRYGVLTPEQVFNLVFKNQMPEKYAGFGAQPDNVPDKRQPMSETDIDRHAQACHELDERESAFLHSHPSC